MRSVRVGKLFAGFDSHIAGVSVGYGGFTILYRSYQTDLLMLSFKVWWNNSQWELDIYDPPY